MSTHVHRYQDEWIALQDTLDGLAWTLTQKEETVNATDSKVKALSEQYKDEKEHIGLTTTASQQEIDHLERQVQKLKLDSNHSLVVSQQKSQKAVVE